MLNSDMSDEIVMISKKELERLQKLEADLPAMLEAAKEEERKDALTRLHQRDKENPDAARARAIKRYNRNKDEINAKRREAYHLKKSKTPGVSLSVGNEKINPGT
jgi:hypothetical protein